MNKLSVFAAAVLLSVSLLKPSTSQAGVIVHHNLLNVLPATTAGWTFDFQLPQTAPSIGGQALYSVEVFARIVVDTTVVGGTTAEGFYGYWASWTTRIYASNGACCEGRVDSGDILFGKYDSGNNASFFIEGQEDDQFNMNPITDHSLLTKWLGNGQVNLTMEVLNPRLTYVWEPNMDTFVPDPVAPGRAVGRWQDCPTCNGVGPNLAQYFIAPTLQSMSVSITEIQLTYQYGNPNSTAIVEPSTLSILTLGLAGLGFIRSRPLAACRTSRIKESQAPNKSPLRNGMISIIKQ